MRLVDTSQPNTGGEIGNGSTQIAAGEQGTAPVRSPPLCFRIQVTGETAVVTGTAASQEQRERILLAIRKVHSMVRVEDRITIADPSTAA